MPGTNYYYSDAVRVYLWDKFGFDIPGLSEQEIKELVDAVKKDPALQGFADKMYYKTKRSSLSDAQMYMQAGNSVTVNVVEAILDHLIKHNWFK